ncbi:MAG: hypothetical protein LBV69_06480 [Bacteroidales bacterium]|jgi:phosphopantetheinyl transferase|nr:hypothetical protein [Bacteroidales bacterium]
MPIILENFAKNNSISGIWKTSESEEDLLELITLSDYDKNLLKQISLQKRRLEIIATRVLMKNIGINRQIIYKNHIPTCNNGFISISHSNNLVAVIWHPTKKTTIDIELISEKITRVSQKVFSNQELLFADNNQEILTILWNCKECVYKIFQQENIEFKKQIKVFPFEKNKKINCSIVHNNIQKIYTFNYLIIDKFSMVWGTEDH